jgi:hypothetical protein
VRPLLLHIGEKAVDFRALRGREVPRPWLDRELDPVDFNDFDVGCVLRARRELRR